MHGEVRTRVSGCTEGCLTIAQDEARRRLETRAQAEAKSAASGMQLHACVVYKFCDALRLFSSSSLRRSDRCGGVW